MTRRKENIWSDEEEDLLAEEQLRPQREINKTVTHDNNIKSTKSGEQPRDLEKEIVRLRTRQDKKSEEKRRKILKGSYFSMLLSEYLLCREK